ncbi:MAG: protein-glutamate O-methyltransferase CheR [Spirochaetes bacterium]|nr:protein-glutamate O-methyltransferase CheR [Spirochaetota bacterium]
MRKLLEGDLVNINYENLSDELFNEFSKLAYQRAGIYLKQSKKLLVANRLRKRLKILNLSSYEDYYKYLIIHPEEISEFINSISTNETYFFRSNNQIEVLKNRILPLLFKKKEKIKIWSAGCSTGEEPYSIAIACDQIKSLYRVEIYATDINTKVLEDAKNGVYNDRKLRGTEQEIINEYFNKIDENNYIIKSQIKNSVKFFQHNLLIDKYINDIDIVFCRNVMIYFNRETQKYVVDKFYESLNRGGFLFLGHAETLYVIKTDFKYLRIDDCTVYYKE